MIVCFEKKAYLRAHFYCEYLSADLRVNTNLKYKTIKLI